MTCLPCLSGSEICIGRYDAMLVIHYSYEEILGHCTRGSGFKAGDAFIRTCDGTESIARARLTLHELPVVLMSEYTEVRLLPYRSD